MQSRVGVFLFLFTIYFQCHFEYYSVIFGAVNEPFQQCQIFLFNLSFFATGMYFFSFQLTVEQNENIGILNNKPK